MVIRLPNEKTLHVVSNMDMGYDTVSIFLREMNRSYNNIPADRASCDKQGILAASIQNVVANKPKYKMPRPNMHESPTSISLVLAKLTCYNNQIDQLISERAFSPAESNLSDDFLPSAVAS